MPSSEQKSVVTVRVSEAMKAKLQQAADEKGGNLSAEILHRLADYESLRSFTDHLLDDIVANEMAIGLGTIRKGAKTTPIESISDAEQVSLERAVVTAACISKLFGIVTEHAGHMLAKKRETRLADGWKQRIEAGKLDHNFDIPTTAAAISTDLTKLAAMEGANMAFRMGPAVGPSIWDICFDKNDPLRVESSGAGGGLMGVVNRILHKSDLDLPQEFMPPPTTEDDRLSIIRKLEEISQFPEGSGEKELQEKVIGMLLFDDPPSKPFGTGFNEPNSDVAAS